MNRYPSPFVKVAFDGPDVKEEALYELLRASQLLLVYFILLI